MSNVIASQNPNMQGLQAVVARRVASLKRRLGVVAVISLGFAAGGAAMYFAGDAFYASRQDEERQLKSKIGTLSSQSQQMQQDAIEATDAIALNDYLSPLLGTNDFSLSRELLTQRMRVLSEQFHLNEVAVRASAIRETEKPVATLSTGKEISMQVELEIRAASDAQILRFIDSLPVSLPGYVEVTSVEMNREGYLEADTLLAIAQEVKSSTVKAKLIFLWHGIRPNQEAAPAAGATPADIGLPGGGA